MTQTERAKRNLNPHQAARFAMYHWHDDYAQSGGGSMDFWDSLSPREREFSRDAVRAILTAAKEEKPEPKRAPIKRLK